MCEAARPHVADELEEEKRPRWGGRTSNPVGAVDGPLWVRLPLSSATASKLVVPTDSLRQQTHNQASIEAVQRWRRGVVLLWIITMVAAVSSWALLSAIAVPGGGELASAALLLLLAGLSTWNMRRGKCPRCGAKIRFRPRIELPRFCQNCAAPFIAAREEVP